MLSPLAVFGSHAGFGGPGRATPTQQFRGNSNSNGNGFSGYTPAPQQQGYNANGGNQRRQAGAANGYSGYEEQSQAGVGGRVNQRKGPIGNKTSTARTSHAISKD